MKDGNGVATKGTTGVLVLVGEIVIVGVGEGRVLIFTVIIPVQ